MKEREKILSIYTLKSRYDYLPDLGIIYSKIYKRFVGCDDGHGYIALNIKQKPYKAHRVAWAIHHGAWPNGEIDHIDGNGKNNRLTNLRLVTHSQNCKNRKLNSNNNSKNKGVSWYPKYEKWRAYISLDGKWISLGYFTTKEEAIAARQRAELKYHGEYARAA